MPFVYRHIKGGGSSNQGSGDLQSGSRPEREIIDFGGSNRAASASKLIQKGGQSKYKFGARSAQTFHRLRPPITFPLTTDLGRYNPTWNPTYIPAGAASMGRADFRGPQIYLFSVILARSTPKSQSAHERDLELVSGADFAQRALSFESDPFPGPPGPAVCPEGPKFDKQQKGRFFC